MLFRSEKVGNAIDEVADFVGDVEEIGSSDVSGWVRHVEQMLGNKQGVAEDVPVPTAMTAPEQSQQADAADAQQQAAMVAGAQAQKAQEVQAKRQEIQGQIKQYQKDITNLQRSLSGPL